ncbi:MAG TPA: hypothetical protein VJ648_11490 [Vicinamibacteria bacterium]|nr:hypothetical protein [Vicinamibacteria bacterium]
MSDEEAPKSAYELILERLKQKDRADGVTQRVLSDEQKQRIAELRRVYEAKLAEREILHQSDRQKAGDLDALDRLEQDYRRDRERIASERDRKIDAVRES